jgi:hypothetical protein
MRAGHVASLDDSQLKLVLVTMGLRVVAAVAASEDEGEGQSIDQASLLEANGQFIAILLPLNIIDLLEVILEGIGMYPPNQKIELP